MFTDNYYQYIITEIIILYCIMNTQMEGKNVPESIFKTRHNGEWVDRSTADVFSGKTVVVFSLPGAFTPTCSSTHVPRYEELHECFEKESVDDIYCISVNDAFVMEAWAADQEVSHVKLLPDGNGEFTEKMGMLVDKSDIGFGKRSWRYSMLVKDGVIEKIFSEPEKEGDPFEVSDADTMLSYINENADIPKHATIFTRSFCPFCAKAKVLLKEKNISFSEVHVGSDISTAGFRAIHGNASVPQVYIEGKHVGGSDELEAFYS